MGNLGPGERPIYIPIEENGPAAQMALSIENDDVLVWRVPLASLGRFVEQNREPIRGIFEVVKNAMADLLPEEDEEEDEDARDDISFASGLCSLSERRHEFIVRDEAVKLRFQSFVLLSALARQVNEPVDTAELIKELYGTDPEDKMALEKGRILLLNRISLLRGECNDALPGLGDPKIGLIRSVTGEGRIIVAYMLRKKLKLRELHYLTNRGK